MNILDKSKIIFVCLSNTTISPIAESFFKKMVLEEIEVTSAGIYSFNSESADKDAIDQCLKYGVDLTKHVSKNIKDIEINDDDLVLTADFKQINKFKSLSKKENVEIYTIKEFAGDEDLDLNKLMGYDVIVSQIIDAITKIIDNQNLTLNLDFMENIKNEDIDETHSQEKLDFYEKDFKYFDYLINDASKEIILDSDINLGVNQEHVYPNGIKINKNNIVIDGGNNIVDACGKTSIFDIVSGNVTLKNIVFKNAYSKSSGGAIKHKRGKLKLINCKFINNVSDSDGGVIDCMWGTELTVESCEFVDNHAEESACINNFNGVVKVSNSTFEKNSVKSNASVINNEKYGKMIICDSKFVGNSAINAGVILNWGKCKIYGSEFIDNSAEKSGGVINNQITGNIEICKCDFSNNCSGFDGGAIINFSRMYLADSNVDNNYSREHGGAISNQKGSFLKITSSRINNNSSDIVAGGILNWSELIINDTIIENNSSREFGGAISNQEDSNITINNSKFINNKIDKYGGAIFNLSILKIANSIFENNTSDKGGAIISEKGSNVYIRNCEFDENHAARGSAIFVEDETKLFNCTFFNHKSNEVIYNDGSLLGMDNKICNNDCKNIIFNDEDAYLDIYAGLFKNNAISKSVIYNVGHYCNVSKATFDGNDSKERYCSDITNESYLILNDIKFKSNGKTVLNYGHVDFKNLSKRMIKNIHNLNTIEEIKPPKGKKFDFNRLFDLIQQSDHVKLTHDFCAGNYELDYFEGGIDLKKDGLVIDGNGHIIEGNNRTRIFIVTGKDITLKNIIFKNATVYNKFDKHSFGGGAIHIVSDSSLTIENCTFLNNYSEGGGGAILNNGKLQLIGSKFGNNVSNSFGGAVHNKSELEIDNGEFINNSSKVGGAIYNQGKLTISSKIALESNDSQFSQAIYNANILNSSIEDIHRHVFNSGGINVSKRDFKTFTYLEDKINGGSVVDLDYDIRFDFRKESNFKYWIQLRKDLTINGNGHAIDAQDYFVDGKNSASLFKIKKGCRVVFKNIIFKNCYSDGQSIINNRGDLILESCKFLNNRATADNSLIENTGNLKLINSSFFNNMSGKRSLVYNKSVLEVDGVDFINNNSSASGCCIFNYENVIIRNSRFKSNTTKNRAAVIYNEEESYLNIDNVLFEHNSADINAGVINNYGTILMRDSKFIKNKSKNYAGVILNQSNCYIEIIGTEFMGNETKVNGGGIYNYGNIKIENSKFINNTAHEKGGAIGHREPLTHIQNNYLRISNTEFINNFAEMGPEICTKLDTVELINCKFKKD